MRGFTHDLNETLSSNFSTVIWSFAKNPPQAFSDVTFA